MKNFAKVVLIEVDKDGVFLNPLPEEIKPEWLQRSDYAMKKQSLRCKLGFHKWSVWMEKDFYLILEKQDRFCLLCWQEDRRYI